MKSLGVLEQEIVSILWQLGSTSIKEIHRAILSDPDRELTTSSILNVLRRLEKKGWVKGEKKERIWYWSAIISEKEAKIKTAYNHLHHFLSLVDEQVMVAFAHQIDRPTLDKLIQLTQNLQDIRSENEE